MTLKKHRLGLFKETIYLNLKWTELEDDGEICKLIRIRGILSARQVNCEEEEDIRTFRNVRTTCRKTEVTIQTT